MDFTTVALKGIGTTKFSTWPTKEDPSIYKFNSFWIELREWRTIIERETYSLFDWMGDVGGLYDGLGLLIHRLLKPIAVFALNSELLTLAFKLVKRKSTDETVQRSHIL